MRKMVMATGLDYQYKRILVLGLGISGRSAARFAMRRGGMITGVDRNVDLLNDDKEIADLRTQGMMVISDNEAIAMDQFDLVVVSPGISPSPYAPCQPRVRKRENARPVPRRWPTLVGVPRRHSGSSSPVGRVP